MPKSHTDALCGEGRGYFQALGFAAGLLLMNGTNDRLTFALQTDEGAGDAPRLLLLL